MTTSRDPHWPEGERYRAPVEPEPLMRLCSCGARHDKPTPWCAKDHTVKELPDGQRP